MPDNFDFSAESEELLKRALAAFAEWAAANWAMTTEEAETLTEPTDAPAIYARGYRDAVAAIPDMVELWAEEFGYA